MASGFYKAPFCKGALLTLGLSTAVSSVLKLQQEFPLQLFPHLRHQPLQFLSRLLTHHFVFANSGELLVGGILLYNFRVFERRYGTSKFASYAFQVSLLSTLVQLVILSVGHYLDLEDLRYAASGPYGLIFALFVNYFFDIPAPSSFQIFPGVSLSSKSFMYLFGFQLMVQSPAALISASSGIIAGLIYKSDVGGFMQRWRFPSFVCGFFSRYVAPLLYSAPASASSAGAAPPTGQPRSPREAAPGATPFHSRMPPSDMLRPPSPQQIPVEPSEEHIAILTSMGFDREEAWRVLRQCNNDVQRATNILLDNH